MDPTRVAARPDSLLVDGVRVELRRSARRRKTLSARQEGEVIVVLLPSGLAVAQEQQWAQRLARRVISKASKRAAPAPDALTRRAQELAAQHLEPALGHPLPPFQVRYVTNQARRWGSCTPGDGSIRLSSRLQEMPSWVVDHVLLHEMVHLVESHHTPRFHALVDATPRAERAKGFLEGWEQAHQASGNGDAPGELEGDDDPVD